MEYPPLMLVDDKVPAGFIAFQVHSIYGNQKAGRQVKLEKYSYQN